MSTFELPPNFKYVMPHKPKRGTHLFPTSEWSVEALGWRVVVKAPPSESSTSDFVCDEEHVQGYWCGARMRYRKRNVFVSELVVYDEHRETVPPIDALAAPHFVSHELAPAAYAAALCKAQQKWHTQKLARLTEAKLVETLIGRAPEYADAVACFPWCLSLSRAVQQGVRENETGATFLIRCSDLRIGPLSRFTGLLERTSTLAALLALLVEQLEPPMIRRGQTEDPLDVLLQAAQQEASHESANDVLELSDRSVERSAPDDSWLWTCTKNVSCGVDVLRALVNEHSAWYSLSPQFVGLTLYCLRQHQLCQTRIEKKSNTLVSAQGATPFEALAAARLSNGREGEADLRVQAAILLLERANALVANEDDWINVLAALHLLANPPVGGMSMYTEERPFLYTLMCVTNVLSMQLAIPQHGCVSQPYCVDGRDNRQGQSATSARAIPTLQAADNEWRVCVQKPPPMMFEAKLRRSVEDNSFALYRQLCEKGPNAVIVNKLLVRDLHRLVEPQGWLNDECVSELCATVGHIPPNAIAINSQLSWLAANRVGAAHKKLCERIERLPVSIQGNQIVSLAALVRQRAVQRVLIPWHIDNAHWALLAIDLANERVDIYDSLSVANGSVEPAGLRRLLAALRIDSFGVHHAQCLQQSDGYNCGVFTAVFAQVVALNETMPSRLTPHAARLKMAKALVNRGQSRE